MAETIGSNPAFQHIMESIFESLEINDLNTCQKVSTYWRRLLENANFWLKNDKLDESIYGIASSGNLEALQFLNTIFPKDKLLEHSLKFQDAFGRKAIHMACQEGHLKIVEFLTDSDQLDFLQKQITVNDLLNDWSPFDYASLFGHVKIVKHLIQILDHIRTIWIREYENEKYKKLEYKAIGTVCHDAIIIGHVEILKVLLDFDEDMLSKMGYDLSKVIEFAVLNGHFEALKFLMPHLEENCFDSDELSDDLYIRLLNIAAKYKHIDIMKWLILKVSNPLSVSTKLAQEYGCNKIVAFVKLSVNGSKPHA